MMVTHRESALAWLQAWSERPRRGILLAAIEGLMTIRSIERSYQRPDAVADADAALEVLTDALDRQTAEVKP